MNTFNVALEFVRYIQRKFSSHINFNISDYSDKTEIKTYLLSTSVKPEITLYIHDVYYDIFVDTKHKILHKRCFCKAEVKDMIKLCIAEYYNE